MASSLKSFLRKSSKVQKSKTIPVTIKAGDNLEIDIRELTPQEIKRLRSQNIKTYPPAEGSAMATTSLDDIGFAEDICLTGITAPDLKSSELITCHAGVGGTAKDVLYGLFSLSMISQIASEIMNLTNEDPDNKPTTEGTEPKLVNEAKNS